MRIDDFSFWKDYEENGYSETFESNKFAYF